MSRLAPLQLVTSPTHFYKKLDEFGQGYDKQVKKNGRKDKKLLAERMHWKEKLISDHHLSRVQNHSSSLLMMFTIIKLFIT